MEPAAPPPPGAARPASEHSRRKHQQHPQHHHPRRGPAPLAVVSQTETTKRYMVHGAPFDVPLRYDLIDVLGVGSYGVVCRAVNTTTKERVAIKKMANVFVDLTDSKRILRELKILLFLSHPNVVSIKDAFWINRKSCDTIGIVTELMDTDLQRMIKEGGGALTEQHHRFFVYQVLRALKYIHSAGIIHRDLKPGNLLINSNCDLRVCDFGLARGMEGARLTEYVVTRWFRPPELLLMTSDYGPAVDMWSVGCILAELIGGKPLFPGRDYIHQLELITDVVGVPPRQEMTTLPEEAILHLESIAPKVPRRLRDILPAACPPEAIDLLEKLLVFTPEKRLTAEQALAHPYFASLHDPLEEPIADKEWFWEHESRDLTQEELRALFWQELSHWQAEDSNDINEFLA